MSLVSTYKEYILEKLLLKYLKDGVIPTAEQLEIDLIAYQELHPDLSLPRSKYVDFSVTRGDNSSIALFQETIDVFSDDISVIVREIYNLAKQSSKFYERWSFETRRLAAKAQILEAELDSLLLLTNNTAGYFSSVGDIFTDMNLVDTENTTTSISVEEQSVTLNPGTEESGSISQVNTEQMTDRHVSFYPLSQKAGITTFDLTPKNSVLQVFKTSNTTWVGKVVASVGGKMTCELKAQISETKDINVSRIAFDYTGPPSSKSTVSLLYSVDGYTWYIVPTTEATKVLIPNMSWTFPLTEMRWIKFIFNKPTHDEGQYEYLFSCRHIRLYGTSYYQDRGNILISKALSAVDSAGNILAFNRAQIDVCENVPENTDIKYYLSASIDNSTWTPWAACLPSAREEVKYPKVISFGGASWKDNTETESVALNASYDKNSLTTTFDSSILIDSVSRDLVSYKFKDISFAAVNCAIPVETDGDPDPIANSVALWRNLRHKTTYPDTLTVRGTPRGWGNDGQIYSCSFEIISKDGKQLDFGDRVCKLDGQHVSGVIRVLSGVHKFETTSDNWFDIADNYIGSVGIGATITTEETLKKIDPLYPYNHKLVIEGFPYSTDFQGEKIYSGTDTSGEFYATRASLFDLENNLKEYGYFSTRGIGKDAEASTLALFVRYDSNNSDYVNELFLSKWRVGQSTSGMCKYVKLKAELETNSIALTPALTSYRIKLGL